MSNRSAIPLTVACLDVGSVTGGGVGWAVQSTIGLAHGTELGVFVDALADTLSSGSRVALGFECPLYVPRRIDLKRISSKREGEGGLNWSGGPGPNVLTTGLVQVNWVLSRLAERDHSLRGTTRWIEFDDERVKLFVWEAFITSEVGGDVVLPASVNLANIHEKDAISGVMVFSNRVAANQLPDSDLQAEPAISLIGMHLLMTGLNEDRTLLEEPCLVVRARKPQ
jgi:hypothetical protein